MKITALGTFRPKNQKGVILHRGESLDVDDSYGAELVRAGLAVHGAKALKEHEDKMLREYEDKGMPTVAVSAEARTQGVVGPSAKSQTPEQRNQGKDAKK